MIEGEHTTAPEMTADDALADVTYTLAHISEAFVALDECIDTSVAFPSDTTELMAEIQKVIDQINEQDRLIKESLAMLQKPLQEEAGAVTTASTAAALNTFAAEWIREEVSMQVKEQVDVQIVEHLPESLQKQADDSKRQLADITISLTNSEARMINSFIENANTNDRLSVVFNPEGHKSPLYPANTRSLFGYDLQSAKDLCAYYDLPETDDLWMNFRQFLKHIGTSIEVGVSPS